MIKECQIHTLYNYSIAWSGVHALQVNIETDRGVPDPWGPGGKSCRFVGTDHMHIEAEPHLKRSELATQEEQL